MQAIIAGGRTYQFTAQDIAHLDRMYTVGIISSVVHGGARGADKAAGKWAALHGVEVSVFQADWERFGKAAGPIRNRAMIDHVKPNGILIVFAGGPGTSDIQRQAKRAGLMIYNPENVADRIAQRNEAKLTREEKIALFKKGQSEMLKAN